MEAGGTGTEAGGTEADGNEQKEKGTTSSVEKILDAIVLP